MKNQVKGILQSTYAKLNSKRNNLGLVESFSDGRKRIFYFLIPTHGNIGDQAIAQASYLYLKDYFPEYLIKTVDFDETYKKYNYLKKMINDDDLIFLHGGGNMGDLYPREEYARRFIITNFPKNKIISMPQTVDFSDTYSGKRELKKTVKVYNSHKNLILIAREKRSFDLMKMYFKKNKIVLNPDIVFYLQSYINNDFIKVDRSTIMACIRSDKESVSNRSQILNSLRESFPSLFVYDTVVSRAVPDIMRKVEVESMLYEFMRSKLVVTDRMHGMVFSAITHTPCIVTKSLDQKIKGTYEWIKKLDYVYFVDNLESKETADLAKTIINGNFSFNQSINFDQLYFDSLRSKLNV